MLTDCGIVAIKPYVTDPPTHKIQDTTSRLTVAIRANDIRDADVIIEKLQTEQLFDQVIHESQPSTYDVLIDINREPGFTCGNPQILTYLSFGIIPTGNVARDWLTIKFMALNPSRVLKIERELKAETRHGLWALFLRASKNWKRPDWDHDATGSLNAIFEVILANQDEISKLTRNNCDEVLLNR